MARGSVGGVRKSALRRWSASVRESLASELWPIPTAAIAVGVLLGILIPEFDLAIDDDLSPSIRAWLFSGGVDSARSVLTVIAGSLVTATSLTFSLTIVALQLASNQASPRVLRTFSKDRVVHATLALFVGTFAYSLAVLRTVQDATDTDLAQVPRIAVTLASLLTLASVIQLTLFLAHLAKQLRVETTMKYVHAETSRTIALVAETSNGIGSIPDDLRPARTRLALARDSGFVRGADRSLLVRVAVRDDIVIEEGVAAGHNVVMGTPVATWWSRDPLRHPNDPDAERISLDIASAFALDFERTPSHDLGFGIRQLTDIVVRAMSPGVNDPTTAVHALGHVSAVLADISVLPPQPVALVDDDEIVRVILRIHEFDELLEAALEQPRRYGAEDPVVVARLFQLIREVAYRTSDPAHRSALEGQLRRLEATVAAVDYDEIEVARFAAQAAAARSALTGEWDFARD